MKKKKARHLWHGAFAFFILFSFLAGFTFLETQGNLITSFAVNEVNADNPIAAALSIGIPFGFRWQGQEYTLKASTISLGEGKIKLEVSKGSVSSAAAKPAATTTTTRSPATTTTSPRTTTAIPTTTTRSSATTTISPTRTTTTTPTTTSTRTIMTTPTTATRTTSATTLAKCRDKIDNDKDGKTDYPADRGCTSLNDNDETNTITTSTTSTRTTTTTPTTTATRSTTTTTTSGSTVTGRATVATTTAARSPTTTTTPTTTTSTTAARSTSTATTSALRTTSAVSSSKKLGDFELLKTEAASFDLDGDGNDDVTFTLLDVPSSRQASVEIKIVEETVEAGATEPSESEVPMGEPGTEIPIIEGKVVYSNDLIEVNEMLDEAGQPTASYEVTYYFNEVGKRIPFSFPCKPEGVASIEDEGALGGIADKIKAVYSYDANEKWLIWNPNPEAPSNMQDYFYDYFPDDPESAQFFFGYYLVLKEEAELTITCSDFGDETFGMIQGWNVFGIHGIEEKEAGEFLKESAEILEIHDFKEGKIQKLGDKKKTKLQPGKVYWANLKKGIDLQNPAGIIKTGEP